MQQFTVPQFIDVEDKIIGPLSVRQFIILMIAAIITALFFKLFDFTLFLISGIITMFVGGLFAFLKVRGLELHYFLLCMFQTLLRPGLRLWNRDFFNSEPDIIVVAKAKAPEVKHFTSSHLNKLSLIVDTKGYYADEASDTNVYKQGKEPEDMLIG